MENNERVYLRDVTREDCDLLFSWANNKETRKNSFNSEQIDYKEHVEWFNNLLLSDNRKQFLLMAGSDPVGQVRIDIYGNCCEISYSIEASNRNKGYGTEIIKLAIDKIKNDFSEIKTITARIKPENVASMKCFEKNGFEEKFREYTLEIAEQ